MRKLTFDEIKNKKNYSRDYYRKLMLLLEYSLIIMLLEIVSLFFLYLMRPLPDFYATNSASAIRALKAMEEPNYLNEALLPPDLPSETEAKLIM